MPPVHRLLHITLDTTGPRPALRPLEGRGWGRGLFPDPLSPPRLKSPLRPFQGGRCTKATFRAGKGEKRPNWPLGLHRLAMDPGGEGGVYARRLTEIPEGGKSILLQSGPLP